MMREGYVRRPTGLLLAGLATFVVLGVTPPAAAQTLAPGGFLELASSTEVRPRPTATELQTLLPARGSFTFPAPYNTTGVRLTNGADCGGGGDCVNYVGYSYWRNINNHTDSDTMLIFLGLGRARGGPGPSLFSFDKATEEVRNLGPLFDATDPLSWHSGEGWYFSASQATTLYLNSGPRMLRYDVLARQFATVFDVSGQFGSDKYIWQMHSSDDDRVHSATLRRSGDWAMLGCVVYREDLGQLLYYAKVGDFDECQIDRSGRWLVMKENVDGVFGEDNRIIDVETGSETIFYDQDGAAGHSDLGHGYMVAEDNWASVPGAVRIWEFDRSPFDPDQGLLSYMLTDWAAGGVGHIAHANAAPGTPLGQQYACSSKATRLDLPRANEVVCYRLDTSLDVLVVAPVMTDLDAPGGGDDYAKLPKGNLDVTGQYFIWTSNVASGRLDAFIVKLPSHLLVGGDTTAPSTCGTSAASGSCSYLLVGGDTTAPTVSVYSPAEGTTVSGTVTITANPSDNVGVARVQFFLDGAPAVEDTVAPYEATWDTTVSGDGSHTLTAVARDAAGNTATSSPVTVTVANGPPPDTTPPSISAVSASDASSSGATITWNTNEPGDSQVEYGTTTALGSSTSVTTDLVTSHGRSLSGLAAATTYYYRVLSRDAAGNLATSSLHTFATQAATPPPPPDSGLVGHWMLDEGSGKRAYDPSPNGLVGTLMESPTWTEGKMGYALTFDGSNDYVAVPHEPVLNAYPLTVAVWLKTAATGVHGILNKYWPGSFDGYQLFVNDGNLCAWYFRSAVDAVWDGSGCTLSTPGLADDAWHHVAFVVDAAGGRLYVDGALQASQPWLGVPGAASTTRDLELGRYSGITDPYWPGTVDDVRVYNRALAVAEIEALAGTGATPALNAVAWTNTVSITVSGNSVQKTAGCDGCPDARASSTRQIASSDGYAEFTVSETATLRYVGLARTATPASGGALDFAIRLQAGIAEVREAGMYRTDVSVDTGDRFRIAIENGRVTYYKDDVAFYTSADVPAYPLWVAAVLYSQGATVTEAVIAGGN